MITCNSLSGGRTSSYIAANYPADINVFALCCIGDHNANAHYRKFFKDNGIIQKVNDRLQKYCPHYPEFVATSEDPIVLKTMLDLEQIIGQEIIWVRGLDWEKMMDIKKAIPNIEKRFCTTIMKMQAIFELLFMHFELPVKMRLGYRYDELERAERFTETWKYATHCEIGKGKSRPIIKGDYYYGQTPHFMNRWETIVWREGEFPLVEDKITHYHIQQFWKDKDLVFPLDSNCQNCFHKDEQQLRKNFDTNKPIMMWSAMQEMLRGNTFKEDYNFFEIQRLGIQLDFFYGGGSGCQAGFCTN